MNIPFLDEVYNKIDFDRELVFKFFAMFSLFEWALKQSEEFRSFHNGKLEADWKAFAERIHLRFEQDLKQDAVRGSVEYLLNNQPKKQTLINNFLDYKVTKRDELNDTVWLSKLIRRVRNNLFHGGKLGYRPERDTPLLAHYLPIH